MYELKIYRGVICHDNEEWYKNWSGTDFSFLMRNLTNFDSSTQKSKKNCCLIGSFDQSI